MLSSVSVWCGFWFFFFFFFFKGEDGIRDVAVTGVQTCALPITTRDRRLRPARPRRRRLPHGKEMGLHRRHTGDAALRHFKRRRGRARQQERPLADGECPPSRS